MKSFLKKFFARWKSPVIVKRDYLAAVHNRLTHDWIAGTTSADAELRSGAKILRARCRDLERNNDYARRYFKLLENNVLGSEGVVLQMKIREPKQINGKWTDGYDVLANQIIEESWSRWGESRLCSVTRQYTWQDLQRLVLRSTARDGFVLVRKHYTERAAPYYFAIEPIEADLLDIDHNATLPNGGVIRLGVEYDEMGAPSYYHLLRHHPGEMYQPRSGPGAPWRERVPASEMLCIYMPERIGQSVGVPWLASSMLRLKHLASYEEAEVTAARVAAGKMGFLVAQANATGAGYSGAETPSGNKYMDVEPGSIEILPQGYSIASFDPSHPSTAFGDFVKSCLRGISSGLGVSYNSLANDLENVNYSSIRAGLIEEREEWKSIQRWFVQWFITPVFSDWLRMAASSGALTNGRITLPATKLDKWNQPTWIARRWPWVDPLKDMQASVLAVEKGFASRRSVIAESGGDIEDTFRDLAADDALAEQYGIDFSSTNSGAEKTGALTEDEK